MMENGGSAMAMAGKECIVLICDKHLSANRTLVSKNFLKIYEIHPHTYLLMSGLATDALTVSQKLKFRINMYELEQNRQISAPTLASMTHNFLYEHRFGPYYIQPIVAGLDPITGETHIHTSDCIGAMSKIDEFAAIGSNSHYVMGLAEALWEPNLEPEDLFEVASQAFLSACDRDSASGQGAVVYLVEKDKITIRHLKTSRIFAARLATALKI